MASQLYVCVHIANFILLLIFCGKVSLEYQDLKDIENPCRDADTCTGWKDEKKTLPCSCSRLCARYGACCKDSLQSKWQLARTSEKCAGVDSTDAGVYMMKECDTLWDGPERTKELCEGGIYSLSDAVSITPVTDILSGVTYANIFCSMCNNKSNRIKFWDFVATREEHVKKDTRTWADIIPRALAYTDETGEWSWGYSSTNKYNKGKFIPVNIHIRIPRDVESMVTKCFPNSVSQCAEDWDDDEVKQKCESYAETIEVPLLHDDYLSPDGVIYKNIHCAICNNVTKLDDAKCKLIRKQDSLDFPKGDESMVLRFSSKFPSTECLLSIAGIKPISDEQDCRTLICDPGFEYQSGKCIPEGCVKYFK